MSEAPKKPQGAAPGPNRSTEHRNPRSRRPRPPVDDTEYVDDLRRQDEAFVRGRTEEYFTLYSSAAKRLAQPGAYRAGHMVTDMWRLWGMVARDTVDVGLRSLRTINQIAADTPVPTEPYRQATADPIRIESTGRVHLRCGDLVRPETEDCPRSVIAAAEVQISPNPLEQDAPREVAITVTVNANAPAGIYEGRVLVYGKHPENPIEARRFTIEVPKDFSRQ
jgi:hypothetical protein